MFLDWIVLGALVIAATYGTSLLPGSKLSGTVRIVDGDSFFLGNDEVRLFGIDAPEATTLRHGSSECYSADARDFARQFLSGQQVTIETDPSQSTYDRFGRLLAHVFLTDRTSVQQIMLRRGYAQHYIYQGNPTVYATKYQAAEDIAKMNKIGMWGECRQ